jgi:hypothetical protein
VTDGPSVIGPAVIGVTRLDEHVLLADACLAMTMVSAGARRLIDLRGETRPPGLPVPIDHFPLIDLEADQDELILAAATRLADLAGDGVRTGLYCQAGVSRTAAVAIAYLMVRGLSLAAANAAVRRARPQAMPAPELWRSLERLAPGLDVRAGGKRPARTLGPPRLPGTTTGCSRPGWAGWT